MRFALTLQVTVMIASAGLAYAQDYPNPNKPLRILTAALKRLASLVSLTAGRACSPL